MTWEYRLSPLGHRKQLPEIQMQHASKNVMVLVRILAMCALWPWYWRYDLESSSWRTPVHGNNPVKYWEPTLRNELYVQTKILAMSDLHLGYITLGQGHDTLGPWTKKSIVKNIIKIEKPVKIYNPEKMWTDGWTDGRMERQTGWFLYVQTLFPGGIIIIQKSSFNMAIRSYGPDTDLSYMYTVDLTMEIWPWVKVMTQTLIIDNCIVKYYPYPTFQ